MGTTTKILATLIATLFCLAAAWWFQRSHVTSSCRTTRSERNGSLIAIADESERAHDDKGHGKPLHGEIAIDGRCYHFRTGGRGRGSIPFGRYSIGRKENHPYLGGPAYPISNIWDAFAHDTRRALFIHCGSITAGCIGIAYAECNDFMKAMAVARPRTITLLPRRDRDQRLDNKPSGNLPKVSRRSKGAPFSTSRAPSTLSASNR